MSADKYPCIFLRQMAVIVYIFHTLWVSQDILVTPSTVKSNRGGSKL